MSAQPAWEPPSTLREHVAAEVRAWRGRRRMTQADLSRILGLSQAQVSERLSGKLMFTLDEIDTLTQAFGIPRNALTDMPRSGIEKQVNSAQSRPTLSLVS